MTISRTHVRRAAGGFTAVETVLGVAILAILVAVVVPGVRHREQLRPDAAAKTLALAAASALDTGHSFRASRRHLLERVPALRSAAWSLRTTRRTFTLRVRGADGRTYSIRRRADGRVTRTCRPRGAGCPGGRW